MPYEALDQFHYDFGLHSNIPECCVRSWVENRTSPAVWDRLVDAKLDKAFGYSPCAECADAVIRGVATPNEIHICDPVEAPDCMLFLFSKDWGPIHVSNLEV